MVKFVSVSDLDEMILRFGIEIVMKLIKEKEYVYFQTDDELLEYGFNKKVLGVVRGQVKREKLIEHLVKSSGKVKKTCVGQTVSTYINDSDIEQPLYYKLLLSKLYTRFSNVYYENYIKKFDGIDIDFDPITCERIHTPCYIKPDFDKGCNLVYDLTTILDFRIEDGKYISAFTKTSFESKDIIKINFMMKNILKNTILLSSQRRNDRSTDRVRMTTNLPLTPLELVSPPERRRRDRPHHH
jgi:hypothetical protein